MDSLLHPARPLLAALALACAASSLAEVPTDRLIVRLAGGAPAQSVGAAQREALAARLSARTGELMRPLRVMGDGAQVMQLFRRVTPAVDFRAVPTQRFHPDLTHPILA